MEMGKMSKAEMAETMEAWKGEPDVLRIYSFDKERKTDFLVKIERQGTYCVMMVPHCFVCIPCLCMSLTYIEENTRDKVNAEHVALTHDGIKYKTDMYKTGLRLDCQDQGATSKTIPYDRIQDTSVKEPAGASGVFCCCLVPNVLTTVEVQTAANGASSTAELTLVGLLDADGFRRDVLALKRGLPLPSEVGPGTIEVPDVQYPLGADAMNVGALGTPASAVQGMGFGTSSAEIVSILREHTELLRSIDQSLKQQRA